MGNGDRLYKTIVLVLVAIALVVTMYTAYRDFLSAYVSLMFTENYSYLIVAVPIAVGVFLKLVLDRFSVEGVNIFRIVTSVMFFSSAILFYIVGDTIAEVYIELKTLSVVFLLWSLLVLFLRSRRLSTSVASMILLLIPVPVPRHIVDSISSILTYGVARAVATITSTELVEVNGMIVLTVEDSVGIERSFEVAPICSGIVSLLSVLSIVPLAVYISSLSRSSTKKKVLYVIFSIALAIAIVFVGNISRIALLVIATRAIGYETALQIFHYTPSILYVAIATAVSIGIVSKLLRKRSAEERIRIATYAKPSIAFSGSIALLVLTTIAFNAIAPTVSNVAVAQSTPSVISLPKFIENPASIVLNSTEIYLIKDLPEPKLGATLGVPVIRSIEFVYNNTVFLGYVEVADAPTKFHGWYVCVTMQGYRIDRSWSELGNVTINHMVISRSGARMLLSYAIYRYVLQEGTTYVRLSIMTSVSNDHTEQVQMAREILSNVKAIELPRFRTMYILDAVMIATNISITIGFILLVTHHIGKVLHNKLYIFKTVS